MFFHRANQIDESGERYYLKVTDKTDTTMTAVLLVDYTFQSTYTWGILATPNDPPRQVVPYETE